MKAVFCQWSCASEQEVRASDPALLTSFPVWFLIWNTSGNSAFIKTRGNSVIIYSHAIGRGHCGLQFTQPDCFLFINWRQSQTCAGLQPKPNSEMLTISCCKTEWTDKVVTFKTKIIFLFLSQCVSTAVRRELNSSQVLCWVAFSCSFVACSRDVALKFSSCLRALHLQNTLFIISHIPFLKINCTKTSISVAVTEVVMTNESRSRLQPQWSSRRRFLCPNPRRRSLLERRNNFLHSQVRERGICIWTWFVCVLERNMFVNYLFIHDKTA